MSNKYIDRELAREIIRKVGELGECDEYEVSSCCQKQMRKSIEENARLQSYRIENPNAEIPFSVPRNRSRSRRKELRKSEGHSSKDLYNSGIRAEIANLNSAAKWAKQNFDPDNLDESFFRGIAKRIFPKMYKGEFADYRNVSARIRGSRVIPPDSYKVRSIEIPDFTSHLADLLECKDVINGVEAAAYAHLHIARIHPFVDGNGRTARILQDTILDSYGIPVPVIESGERMTYYSLLDSAAYDWKHKGGKEKGRITRGESDFYDYITGKINVSLDKIIESCLNHDV